MAKRLLVNSLRPGLCHQLRTYVSRPQRVDLGSRDIVGYGINGEPSYIDRFDYPMPAIRFKENTPDIMVLREKEKGDWKKLSVDEKKALYRASFCQTFSEMDAPTGDWKGAIAVALLGVTLSIWTYMYYKAAVYPPLPESLSDESQLAQLERMKILRVNPVTGIPGQK